MPDMYLTYARLPLNSPDGKTWSSHMLLPAAFAMAMPPLLLLLFMLLLQHLAEPSYPRHMPQHACVPL